MGIVLRRNTTIIPPGGDISDGVAVFPRTDLQIGISRSAQQLPTALHGHDFTEIAFIESGSGLYTYEGSVSRVEAGDVFVVLPYHEHRYAETEGLAVSNVLFYDDGSIPLLRELSTRPAYRALLQLEPALRQADEMRGRLRLGGDRLRELLGLARKLGEALHSEEDSSAAVATIHFLELVTDLCDAYDEVSHRMGRSLLLVSKAMSYIEQNFREDLRVEDLAKLGNLSLRSFQRHFQRAAGMPVIRYINEQRFQEACRLLKDGRTNVAETALRSGFHDANYFSTRFRKKYGMTPKQYQRHAAKEAQLEGEDKRRGGS